MLCLYKTNTLIGRVELYNCFHIYLCDAYGNWRILLILDYRRSTLKCRRSCCSQKMHENLGHIWMHRDVFVITWYVVHGSICSVLWTFSRPYLFGNISTALGSNSAVLHYYFNSELLKFALMLDKIRFP